MSITSVITKFSVQTIVVWKNPVLDGYGGAVYDEPVEIKGRWDESLKIINNTKGEELISNAQILTNEELKEGDVVFLGSLSDIEDSSIPLESDQIYPQPKQLNLEVFKIVTRDKIYMPRSTSQCVKIFYLKPNWETKL